MKLSSPNLNNLMLVGGMMDYMAVILFGLDAVSVSNVAFDILCTVGVNYIYISVMSVCDCVLCVPFLPHVTGLRIYA